MNPMMAATGIPGMGGIPGFSNGAQSPISSSASSATGDQTQNIGFTGHGVTFGGGGNNQLLIIGGLALAALFLFKK